MQYKANTRTSKAIFGLGCWWENKQNEEIDISNAVVTKT